MILPTKPSRLCRFSLVQPILRDGPTVRPCSLNRNQPAAPGTNPTANAALTDKDGANLQTEAWATSTTCPAVDDLEVLADTGTTDHIHNQRSSFISYKPVTPTDIKVGDNHFVKFIGIGTIALMKRVNGEQPEVHFHNTLYAPSQWQARTFQTKR